MRWMIIDSGLGGLSVMAGLERKLTETYPETHLELLYVNATPDDRIGYNSLPDQQARISLFDTFLHGAQAHFQPDRLIIACNTLSVLYDQTTYSREQTFPVNGIVAVGAAVCRQALAANPDRQIIIFGTETTTEAGTYPRLIQAPSGRLVSQACPGLAHAISNDASGEACREKLNELVPQALEGFPRLPDQVFAFLGCTHYGYQEPIFREVLTAQGVSTVILNPNEYLVAELAEQFTANKPVGSEPVFRFVSRYRIPEAEIQSMEMYLEQYPGTVTALLNQEIIPDLFETPPDR